MATNGHTPETALEAAQFDLATETLRGDVRDVLLGHIRALPKPWPAMSETEQADAIERAERLADTLVREAVAIAAARGFQRHAITIGAFKVDDGAIDCRFEALITDEVLLDLAHRQGHGAVLVPLDLADFLGERNSAAAQPNQMQIPLGDPPFAVPPDSHPQT